MKWGLSSQRRHRWSVALISAAIALITAAGALLAADPDSVVSERLRQVGLARASVATDRAVVEVGTQALTLADLAESRAQVAANLAYMREEIAKGGLLAAGLHARLELIEASGVENVALAALIEKAALYQRAVGEGYGATEEEVAAAVARQRETEGLAGTTALEGYIEAIGEERYWSEVMLAWQRRSLAVGKLYAAVAQGVDSSDQGRVWTQYSRQTVGAAEIRVVAPDAIAPATIAAALEYLDKHWQLALPEGQAGERE